jgi:two-component system sensor histidine kinase UhpB
MGLSLRLGLVAAVSATLLIALAAGGALVCWGAYASVRTEMAGAMAGARDVVREALVRPRADASQALLPDLVMSFNGQRHVRAVVLSPSGQVWFQSRLLASSDRPPAWFSALIGVRPDAVRMTLSPPIAPRGAVLVLQTDPTNEITEVWRQARDVFGVMLVFSGGACLAIYLIVGRAVRRFGAFDSALQSISEGRYDAALVERGAPEFVALARGFNRMAGRIREFERRNRELHEQILTLQQEERAEIARDLHDEVGSYLFAINVDAGDIPRLLRQGEASEIVERAGSIREAAAHIQKHVKAILRQLRPTDALEFGLSVAIGDLIAFWMRRRPGIAFTVDVALDGATIDRRIEDVAYRVVQEAISNAIRHGRPNAIAISIALLAWEELRISVVDDGSGLTLGSAPSGMGLAGMAERVRALNGHFEIAGAPDGGVRATALLPLRLAPRRAPAPAT